MCYLSLPGRAVAVVQQLGPYPAAPEAEGRASSCCMAIPCRDGRWVWEHQENLCLWEKVMERQMW